MDFGTASGLPASHAVGLGFITKTIMKMVQTASLLGTPV